MKPKRNIAQRLLDRFFYKYYARNLLYELQMRARSESADFVQTEMPEAQIFRTHRDIIHFAINNSPTDGLFLEFGVATGNTISEIASIVPGGTTVFGFDSFKGLPENWSGHIETTGAFQQKKMPNVPPNVSLVPGLFRETLPEFFVDKNGRVSFAHIDCDLYSSTATILDHIGSRLQSGTMILFDEYFNYPGWKLHEHRAWMDFSNNSKIAFTYVGFTALDGKVLIRVD